MMKSSRDQLITNYCKIKIQLWRHDITFIQRDYNCKKLEMSAEKKAKVKVWN